MKFSTLFIFLFLAGSLFSRTNNRWAARDFTILSDSVNSTLPSNQSKFVFHVDNARYNDSSTIVIRTAVNGVWRERTLDAAGNFSCIIEPGTYSFQFYFNDEYTEIQRSSLTIPPQHEMTIALRFLSNQQQIMVFKPVIYMHTEVEREFDLSVNPAGNFIFVYPPMNNSWKGIAYPNGDLSIDGNKYPYLFWESNQQYQFHSEGNGYKVEKAEVVSFLQKKLTELGLNQKEQTDFITFWGPKLAQNESSFVQFSIDESCNQFAELTCSPQPESVHRVYIQIAEWDPYFEIFLNDMTFSSVSNDSWSLLEWGGFTFTKPEQLTQY
jgi:hypothetical protein